MGITNIILGLILLLLVANLVLVIKARYNSREHLIKELEDLSNKLDLDSQR